VIEQARHHLGAAYRGDADAPRVEIISEPALGASMDLPASDAEAWSALEATARAIATRCDVYAIACNTLNVYAPRLAALELDAELVSFSDAVVDWATRTGVTRLGLMGARPVASLTEWSPYGALAEEFDVEQPPDVDAVHELIAAVKSGGGSDPALRDRFRAIANSFQSENLLLACTELPLIANEIPGRTLVDVTDLVAEQLIRRWSGMTAG
jgi:aspartate racemase